MRNFFVPDNDQDAILYFKTSRSTKCVHGKQIPERLLRQPKRPPAQSTKLEYRSHEEHVVCINNNGKTMP